jgi:hypothetical protein
MVWGRGWPVLRVYQVCIQYDAQRREHGFGLVRKLIAKADQEGYEAISCYVADDIEANDFWRSCGFLCVGQRDNGNRRKRLHNHWVMRMPNQCRGSLDERSEEKRVNGVVIEKNVPVPSQREGKIVSLLLSLELGESFVYEKRIKPANYRGLLQGRKFMTRAVPGKGFRLWRVA